jgi:crossover junction endodeoxyribonuclease RuvC
MRRILGIDPGLASTGYGIIEIDKNRIRHITHGEIKTKAHTDTGERLNIIYTNVTDLITRYKPSEASIENLFFAKNQKSALPVAQARGVVILAIHRSALFHTDYTPLEIKMALVGQGRAAKSQVQEMLRIILAMQSIPKPDHAADALAAAVCHFHSSELERRSVNV